MLSSQVTNLLGLLSNDVAGVLEMAVDKIFVADVDEGNKIDECGEEEGETPGGGNLDEEVGDECSRESLPCTSA